MVDVQVNGGTFSLTGDIHDFAAVREDAAEQGYSSGQKPMHTMSRANMRRVVSGDIYGKDEFNRPYCF